MLDYRKSHEAKGDTYDRDLESEPFSRYMAKREARLLTLITRRYFGTRIAMYLDFACGTGRIVSMMEKFADRPFAIDVSISMTNIARGKCKNTTFVIGDLTQEKIDLPIMDLITAFRFFGNAQPQLRRQVLLVFQQILASGGYLVLNNHRNPGSIMSRFHRISGGHDDMDLDLPQLIRLLQETGFDIVRVYGIGAWIVRSRIAASCSLLNSIFGSWLEPMSLLPGIARFCPDMIIVARKRANVI